MVRFASQQSNIVLWVYRERMFAPNSAVLGAHLSIPPDFHISFSCSFPGALPIYHSPRLLFLNFQI